MVRRPVIVIPGMHRSGTSALSGLMKDYGFDHGKSLTASNEFNARGYFENDRLIGFNDRLLHKQGLEWSDPFSLIDNRVNQLDLFKEAGPEVISIIRDEFTQDSPAVIKDPRISLLTHFWNEVFNQLNWMPLFIMIHRHSAEVAASLKRRNHLPEYVSEKLWAHYVLTAEKETRGFPRLFVAYEQLLNEFSSFESNVRNFLGHSIPGAMSIPDGRSIDGDLRHHSHVEGKEPSYPLCKAVYETMERLKADPEDPACLKRLDALMVKHRSACLADHGLASEPEGRVIIRYTDEEKSVMSFSPSDAEHEIVLKPETGKSIKSIEFNPVNTSCSVRVAAAIKDHNGHEPEELHLHSHNASYVLNSSFIFDTIYPVIFFRVKNPDHQGMAVSIKVRYMAAGKPALRLASRALREKNTALIMENTHLKKQIESLKGSLTWKAGRIFSKPSGFALSILASFRSRQRNS